MSSDGWTDHREKWLQNGGSIGSTRDRDRPFRAVGLCDAWLLYQLNAQSDQAVPLLEKADALNPNDYYVNEALGYAVTYAGSAERGVDLLEQAQRLNPHHTQERPLRLGGAYFFAHRYQDALAITNNVTNRQGSPTYWLYKAAIHAELGQVDEARAAVADALKLDPNLTLQGEHERRLALGLAPSYAEHLTAALRKAGLPERATRISSDSVRRSNSKKLCKVSQASTPVADLHTASSIGPRDVGATAIAGPGFRANLRLRRVSMERRLAAILAADMVGYSRLMGADEAGTLAAYQRHRRDLINPRAIQYHGRICKLTGDGVLMEFASVVDAVRFAVEVQLALRDENANRPLERQFRYRIGINIGDIVIEQEDIYGDGVNIAARLQELADPGGICLSGTAFDQIKGKLGLTSEYLGEKQVKNIAEPVTAYRVLLDDKAKALATPLVQDTPAMRTSWRKLAAAAAVLLLVLAGGALWWRPWAPEPEPAAGRALRVSPAGQTLDRGVAVHQRQRRCGARPSRGGPDRRPDHRAVEGLEPVRHRAPFGLRDPGYGQENPGRGRGTGRSLRPGRHAARGRIAHTDQRQPDRCVHGPLALGRALRP